MTAQTRPTPFQVGDRILLSVEGDSALSDTFTVSASVSGKPALRLPNIGEISLAGVPRADVETYLSRELGQFIKDPVIAARALIRVSIAGEVVRPGFYAVPIDLVIADGLMLAGGATQEARIDRLTIVRGNAPILSGSALQSAIARGATLDELGIQAGDRIQVPKQRDPESKFRIAGMVITGLAAVVTLAVLTR